MGILVVGNKPSRVLVLSEELQEHIRSESLLPGEAASIKGKLVYSQKVKPLEDGLDGLGMLCPKGQSASPNQTHVGAKLLFRASLC